jgi:putative phosphoesterase
MKYFVISDIHGSATYLEEALVKMKASNSDYLIILGDILYHGARNPLPDGYNPKKCIELLNEINDRIIAIRGNCDSEVDQMVLDFVLQESNILIHNNHKVFLTHGHIYESHNQLSEGDSFVNGHTHVVRADRINGVNYLNPGSISIPKGEYGRSYAIIDTYFRVYNFKDELLKELEL